MHLRLLGRTSVLAACVFVPTLVPGTPHHSAADAAPVAANAPAVPPDTHTITIRGAKLTYVEAGKGPAVVFVHGSLGEIDDWRAQMEPFAERYRVIAYSRRFHPPNAPLKPGGAYAMDEHAEDLAALIRALHAEPAIVVGHSYGAYISLRMTLKHPELVRTLVLGEPPILGWLSGTPEADSVGRALFANALDPARDAFARGDSVDGLRRFLDGVTGKPGRFDAMPAEMRAEVLRYANEMRGEMTTDRARLMPAIACESVGRLKMPVLVLSGETSARFFHIVTEKLHTCLPTADTATVPNAGHAMQVANPSFFNEHVLEFLARKQAAAR
ncbi:MAG TPA: alpha/beta hydrolase [Longimicrobiales bacterium]|nr:alpha/beta hydrolase [Longimicrobiales bacterium]